MDIEEGTLYEYRLKRLYFHMGYITRRGVTVKPLFGPADIQITDIDVLGLKFLTGFRPYLAIGECKSEPKGKKSVGTIDRFLWILGLNERLNADEIFVAKKNIDRKTNQMARKWGILALDNERIEELESAYIPNLEEWIGSHDYHHFHPRHKHLYDKIIRKNPKLKEAYLFGRSGFWYTENTLRLKRTITYIDDLAKDLAGDWTRDDISYSQRWVILDLFILFSLSILCLCHQCYSLSKQDRKNYLAELLAAGLVPIEELKKIRKAANQYIYQKVKELTRQDTLFKPGLSDIPPPEYTESVWDIVERLLAREVHALSIARLLDLVVYECVLKSGTIDPIYLHQLFDSDLEMTLKLAKNLLFVLFDYTSLEKEHVRDLLEWEIPT